MKKQFIAYIREGDMIEDLFFIKTIALKSGKNGLYLDIMLADATGEVNAKKWNAETNDADIFKAGDIVRVDGTLTDFNGQKQMRINRMAIAGPNTPIDRRDFYKAAPENPEDMYAYIVGRIESFEDEDLKKLCLSLYEENRDRLMYYPAAMSNHHAEFAGLLYHVKRMMMMGERACEVYTNLSKDLLLAGVAIHDIEKLSEIESDENGVSPGYSFEGQMLGHLVQGVKVIHDKCQELGICEEKEIMLEHMSISHHYQPEFGSPKKPLFPEAEMLHYLDMIDAKMFDMEDALAGVEPGEFGDKVWTLDNRRPYKRTF